MAYRQATQIEVGPNGGRVGLSVTYDTGEKSHILFSVEKALKVAALISEVANKLSLTVVDEGVTVTAAPAQPKGHAENLKISDYANVGLSGGNDADSKKNVH